MEIFKRDIEELKFLKNVFEESINRVVLFTGMKEWIKNSYFGLFISFKKSMNYNLRKRGFVIFYFYYNLLSLFKIYNQLDQYLFVLNDQSNMKSIYETRNKVSIKQIVLCNTK